MYALQMSSQLTCVRNDTQCIITPALIATTVRYRIGKTVKEIKIPILAGEPPVLMNQAKPIPLRRQQRDFTRQRLVDAARELFRQNGTKGTSIDDIARAAGTSRAPFYAHFTDKQDVIREFARTMWETAFAVYNDFGQLTEW